MDTDSNEYLVTEIYPLLIPNSNYSFQNLCDETCVLDSIVPICLIIKIVDAVLYFNNIEIDTAYISNIQLLKSAAIESRNIQKINNINNNLQLNKKSWIAGETFFSNLTYEEKKTYFGGNVPNLYGLEYYISGYFSYGDISNATASDEIVKEFDWRNRHGSNNINSSYYNSNGEGWIPNRRECQQANDCWAFSVVYTIEAIVNLYYNQMLNLNLSEQYLSSCSGCGVYDSGGYVYDVCGYIRTNGVILEECFPYSGLYQPCSDMCAQPTEKIQTNGFQMVSQNELSVKRNLIIKGPLETSLNLWGHAMCLVGYGVVSEGDIIMNGQVAHDGIERYVQAGSPDIGKQYYIFKQSWGGWGVNKNSSYIYVILDANRAYMCTFPFFTPLLSMQFNEQNIICQDNDGDGYYFWGIGAKPSTCPNCSDLEDCDDSNPMLGPYDNKFACTFLCENYSYSDIPYEITHSILWDEIKYFNQKIIIDSGCILTITNNIHMGYNTSITVKPGGKLIIDGGTLTNACIGELWQGIFIEGNPNDSTQADSLQGVVELINGAVIQNAECGINVGLEKLGIAPEMCAAGGGIVRATNASFINNKKAVEFGPYNRHTKRGTVTLNRNASYFRLCTFKVDNNALFSLSNFKQHVNLLEVREVTFEGCSFESINHTGSAIQSLSSGFVLSDYNRLLLNGIRSRVSNFNTAIQIKDGGTKASSINNTNFYNNNIGILAEGTDAMYIQSDSFNIPYNSYFGPTTGVTLTKCSKFEVNDNYFNGENNCNYGLIIIKSGINNNIVEQNYFNHLSTACIAYGKNSDGENGTVGLQYYCNWFENNNTDIYVGDYETETGTIRYIQGENNNACNNVFSINGTSLYSMNFPFQYYCKNSIYNNQIARNISSNIDTVYKLSDKCNQIGIVNPDIHVEIPGDWEITKGNEYSLINGMLTSVKNQYAGYNYINLDWETYYIGNPVIVDSLIYYGAEFSYDTTIYYTDGRDPLDTIITYRVIDSIVYYYNYIVPEDLEAKVNLYFQINDLQSQLSEICHEAMYYIHSDSIVDLDVYHEWLLWDYTPEADYVLSESYYEEGNYLSALNTLNTVSTKYPLYDENEYTNYVNLYNVKDSLRIKTMSWDSIEELSWEMTTLNSIANSGANGAAFKAQAIETGYYSSTFETTVPFTPLLDLCMYIVNTNIHEETNDSLKSNLSIKNSESTLNNIIIYPNPTNDKLTVKSEHSTMTTLCLYDVIGKEITRYTINEMSTVLDVNNLCKGIYFLKIETENGTVTKRFVKE